MRRLLAWPSTPSGLWACYLVGGFFVMMCLFFGITWLYGGPDEVRVAFKEAGGQFFSLPWVPFTLLGAAVAAIAAGGAALVAILRKGERSILMLLPLAVSALV